MRNEFLEIPMRSKDGLAALDVFYIEFNEVNFYVEDEDQENLYSVIFKKLFPELKIARIFPLCGKGNVLKHAADPINLSSPIKHVYIVDKDFDDMHGLIVNNDRIIYLEYYCIENYLLNELAIVDVVIEEHPKEKREDVIAALVIEQMVSQIMESLRPLFHVFFCVQCLGLGLENCDGKAEEYCHARRLWEVDQSKFADYILRVVAEARAHHVEPPLVDPLLDERAAQARDAQLHALISGKFLLAMLFHYVKYKYKMRSITFDSFVFRVAKNSSFASLEGVTAKIRALLESYPKTGVVA